MNAKSIDRFCQGTVAFTVEECPGARFFILAARQVRQVSKTGSWCLKAGTPKTCFIDVVYVIHIVVIAVSKALMPEKMISTHRELVQMKLSLNGSSRVVDLRGGKRRSGNRGIAI